MQCAVMGSHWGEQGRRELSCLSAYLQKPELVVTGQGLATQGMLQTAWNMAKSDSGLYKQY
jgi:hypothetical protein